MIKFILSCVAAYFIFMVLNALFASRSKGYQLKEGDFVQEINGQFYIVRDVTAPEKVEEPAPHQRRPSLKVVK